MDLGLPGARSSARTAALRALLALMPLAACDPAATGGDLKGGAVGDGAGTGDGAVDSGDGADGDGADGGGADGGGDTGAATDDRDGDGHAADVDCDDQDAGTHPGAAEVCDGRDNDCDGAIDADDADLDPTVALRLFVDADLDGHGDGQAPVLACAVSIGLSADGDDCDDADPSVHPGAEERCDGVDNDCDARADDEDPRVVGAPTWWADRDGDGAGDAEVAVEACVQPAGFVENTDDCDDTDAATWPGAAEVCDGVDNDCDGLEDGGDPDLSGGGAYYADADLDGYGAGLVIACDLRPGLSSIGGDCDDGDARVSPGAAEVCGGGDDDCDGLIDAADPKVTDAVWTWVDADADGFGDPATAALSCAPALDAALEGGDCDDSRAAAFPGAPEVCDGLDNDCDGRADDADPALVTATATAYTVDADGDGFGDEAGWARACELPAGATVTGGDCDDASAAISPAAAEVCDGVDNDCDAGTSEAGLARFTPVGAPPVDATGWLAGALGGAAQVQLDQPGRLELCEGTVVARLSVEADLTVVAHGDVTLTAGGEGRAIEILTPGLQVDLSGITVADGGLRCASDSDLTGEALLFSGVSADVGGALEIDGCAVALERSSFIGNSAATAGGAVALRSGSLRLQGGAIRDNTAPAAAGLLVGAGAELSLDGVEVSGHSAEAARVEDGGLLRCASSSRRPGGFFENGVAVALEGGAEAISYGCSWSDNAVDVALSGGGAATLGDEAWSACGPGGCGPVAAAVGTAERRSAKGVGSSLPVALDCDLRWDVDVAPAAAPCPDCELSFDLAWTYAPARSVEGSCGDEAVDGAISLGFAPDYNGLGYGAMLYDNGYGWVFAGYLAEVDGDELVVWSGMEDAYLGQDTDSEPLYGTDQRSMRLPLR